MCVSMKYQFKLTKMIDINSPTEIGIVSLKSAPVFIQIKPVLIESNRIVVDVKSYVL